MSILKKVVWVLRRSRRILSIMALDLRLYRKDSFKYPLVSIVVPLYNEERFIADCLNSIKRQTYKNWECLIVNDCSTDRSVEVAERIIGGDERFKFLHHDVNSGLSASRNTGLRHASGEFITFLDSDDFLFGSAVWQRVHTLIADDQSNIAGSFCGIVPANEEVGPKDFRITRYLPYGRPELDFMNTRGECPFNAHAPLLKTSLVEAFSGFDETMRSGAEDWDLWSRMMRHGYIFIPSYGYGAAYRQKHQSMVRRLSAHHVREAQKLLGSAYKPFDGEPALEDAPHVFRYPVYHYERSIKEANRFIGYGFMAYLAGNEKSVSEIISLLDPAINTLLNKHVKIDQILDSYLVRYYCLGSKGDIGNKGEYRRQKDAFKRTVLARFSEDESPIASQALV